MLEYFQSSDINMKADDTLVSIDAFPVLGKDCVVKGTQKQITQIIGGFQKPSYSQNKDKLMRMKKKIRSELMDVNLRTLHDQMKAGETEAREKLHDFGSKIIIFYCIRYVLDNMPIPILSSQPPGEVIDFSITPQSLTLDFALFATLYENESFFFENE